MIDWMKFSFGAALAGLQIVAGLDPRIVVMVNVAIICLLGGVVAQQTWTFEVRRRA